MANLGDNNTPVEGESFGLPSGYSFDEENGDLVIRDTDGTVAMRRADGTWELESGLALNENDISGVGAFDSESVNTERVNSTVLQSEQKALSDALIEAGEGGAVFVTADEEPGDFADDFEDGQTLIGLGGEILLDERILDIDVTDLTLINVRMVGEFEGATGGVISFAESAENIEIHSCHIENSDPDGKRSLQTDQNGGAIQGCRLVVGADNEALRIGGEAKDIAIGLNRVTQGLDISGSAQNIESDTNVIL